MKYTCVCAPLIHAYTDKLTNTVTLCLCIMLGVGKCTCNLLYIILIGIVLVYNGVDYSEESYFLSDTLSNIPLTCEHNSNFRNKGQALLPNGDICDDASTSSSIECDRNRSTIAFTRVNTFDPSHELEYTCCLPHRCRNDDAYKIIANIYSKCIMNLM